MIPWLAAVAWSNPGWLDLPGPREPALVPAGVHAVALGPDGALWFALCRDGISRLDADSGRRTTWTAADGVPPGCVTEVAPVTDGAWAITPDRAFQLQSGKVVGTLAIDPSADATVSALTVGSEGTVWLGGQGGRLVGLHPSGLESRWQGGDLAALGTVSALRVAPDGRLYVSSRDRITTLDPATGAFDIRVSHGEPPGLPAGRPGPVAFAPDGEWVVVRAERADDPRGSVVRLTSTGYQRLDLPGLSDRPLRVEVGIDGALWIADDAGVVVVAPDRASARRIGVRRGYVPGGPWALPGPDGRAWSSFEATEGGVALHRLRGDGTPEVRLAPDVAPGAGTLVRTDEGVLLSTVDGLFALDPVRTRWSRHPGFGTLSGAELRTIARVHRGPGGRTWVAGPEGVRVGHPDGGWERADPPVPGPVFDVLEGDGGEAWVAAASGLYLRNRSGSWARVVDDAGRQVAGVSALTRAPQTVWAWGSGGAWTLAGSDAVRQTPGPVLDLVVDGGWVWTVRPDGVRRETPEGFVRETLPAWLENPQQIVVRGGTLTQVRAGAGLWRREGEAWSRVLGGTGPFVEAGGWLWRWDADGLHALPPGGEAWRWIGLGEPAPSQAPLAADQVVVMALAGVLAVEVEGRVVGDPRRLDPIVDIDVRGTRWAALSRQGVLLRGDAYRVLEQTFVPGPSRTVALGPREVCVAGSTVWCRRDGRWKAIFGVSDLPAPLPVVDLDVDDGGRVHALQPGAWCREGLGCRRLKGPEQTSLEVHPGGVWITGLQTLWAGQEDGTVRAVAAVPAIDAAVGPDGQLWLATPQGIARWGSGGADVVHDIPVDEVAVSTTGTVFVRSGVRRGLIRSVPAPEMPTTP